MEKKKVWLTAEKKEIPFTDLTNEDLAEAFTSLCMREFKKFLLTKQVLKQMDTLQELKECLLEEAHNRNIKLQYPDEEDPTNKRFGNYFWAERHNEEIPTLATESNKD